MTNSDRSQIAKIAANTRWARCEDRSAATQAARDGMTRRFEREVDPEGVLPPDELGRRVESARRAYYQRIALKSAQSRRLKKGEAMKTRAEAIAEAGNLAAEHDIAMASMTPREQAEAAWTPTSDYSVDELEDLIRADRGLAPIPRADRDV